MYCQQRFRHLLCIWPSEKWLTTANLFLLNVATHDNFSVNIVGIFGLSTEKISYSVELSMKKVLQSWGLVVTVVSSKAVVLILFALSGALWLLAVRFCGILL